MRKGLIVLPRSSGLACGLTISKERVHDIVMQKYNESKKQYHEHQETFKSFNKLKRKSLQDILSDENECESPCYTFSSKFAWNENWIFCRNMNFKLKLFYLVIKFLKFSLEPRS